MDFAKTKLYQRTRSGYQKLYLEYNEKKTTGKRRNAGTGSGNDGGGLGNNKGGDGDKARVAEDKFKDNSSKKSSEVVGGTNGGRNNAEAVARRTRQGLRGKKKLGIVSKKGKNSIHVELIDESDKDDDGVKDCLNSGIEEVSASEKTQSQNNTKTKHIKQFKKLTNK